MTIETRYYQVVYEGTEVARVPVVSWTDADAVAAKYGIEHVIRNRAGAVFHVTSIDDDAGTIQVEKRDDWQDCDKPITLEDV